MKKTGAPTFFLARAKKKSRIDAWHSRAASQRIQNANDVVNLAFGYALEGTEKKNFVSLDCFHFHSAMMSSASSL